MQDGLGEDAVAPLVFTSVYAPPISLYGDVVTRMAPVQLSFDGCAKELLNKAFKMKIAISRTGWCNFFFMVTCFFEGQISFSCRAAAIPLLCYCDVKSWILCTMMM